MALFARFRHDNRGVVTVETALIMSTLMFMAIGVLDFGLAYTRNQELANAVRAGMQYAMVRKPIDGDYSAIISAVNTAAPSADSATNRQVDAAMFCACPDGTAINCTGTGGEDLTCDDGNLRASYLRISIREDYSLLFPYPGLDDPLSLSKAVVVRLN